MTMDILTIKEPISRDALSDRMADAAPPPASAAPFVEREAWCLNYAERVIARSPSEGPLPEDVRAMQRFEDEFNSCKLDPQEYERQTRAEASATAEAATEEF